MSLSSDLKACYKLGERARLDGFGPKPGPKFIPHYEMVGYNSDQIDALLLAYRQGWDKGLASSDAWGWERMMSS